MEYIPKSGDLFIHSDGRMFLVGDVNKSGSDHGCECECYEGPFGMPIMDDFYTVSDGWSLVRNVFD